jgi:hypothetical protein
MRIHALAPATAPQWPSPRTRQRQETKELKETAMSSSMQTSASSDAEDVPSLTPRSFEDLPGPRPWPLVGSAFQVQFEQIHLDFERWAHMYGPIYKVQLGARKMLVISDHELINAVMKDRPEGFSRPEGLRAIVREMGIEHGLFTAEGQQWHAQRRMVMSAFSPSHVRAYFPLLRDVAQRLKGRWDKAVQAGQPIDLQADLMRFTVDAIAGLAFGAESTRSNPMTTSFSTTSTRSSPPCYRRVNSRPYWRWSSSRRTATSTAASSSSTRPSGFHRAGPCPHAGRAGAPPAAGAICSKR